MPDRPDGAALAMVGGKLVVEDVPDPEVKAKLEARVLALSHAVALKKGIDAREALFEASRTPRGSVIYNVTSASIQYLQLTAEKLEAMLNGQQRKTASERMAINSEAMQEIVDRAEEREREGIA